MDSKEKAKPGKEKVNEIVLKNVYEGEFVRYPPQKELEECFKPGAEREERVIKVDNMEIKVDAPKLFPQFKVEIEYFEPDAAWYDNFYKNQKDKIWEKSGSSRHPKWKCLACKKSFTSFRALKADVNQHMGFFPHKCDECTAQYHSKAELQEHKTTHKQVKTHGKSGKRAYTKCGYTKWSICRKRVP